MQIEIMRKLKRKFWDVSLYNYGCGILNVEKELGIAEEIDDFLVKKSLNLA